MGNLFDGYGEPRSGLLANAFDEVLTADGLPRSDYEEVVDALSGLDPEDISTRATRLARAFMDQGVTFDLNGEERPFPLDVVPRILTSKEWTTVSEGVAQRVRALEAFLEDVYNSARILDDGVIPYEVVVSSPGFLRAVHGFNPPNRVRIHVAGIDVVRDEDGEFRVLEDNLRCPSGVSYVLANRTAMARVLPEIFWGQPIKAVSDYPARLVRALRLAAPSGVSNPTVVVLTPGVYNSAFYEHALLARLMGVHLVEGRDLVCHGTDVFLRTTQGEIPVHVIYRRVDDDYIDPLQFLPQSLVGCPGLLNAARAGRVTVANAVGNGIADDKLVYCYVPDMIRYYLDEDPVLANVETYRLFEPDQCAEALAHRAELVFKQVDGSGGKGLVLGPYATEDELDEVCAKVERSPRSWVAQRLVALSTSPTWVGHQMERRHVDLRPFAVNDGEKVWVLPGGLTRVALQEGGLVVNSSQGGGSKDTWVVGDQRQPPVPTSDRGESGSGVPMDVGPMDGGDFQQQQQQQQQQMHVPIGQRQGPAVSSALLSRVAESIFWVGRYTERAEGTARILDVVVYQALEQSDDVGAAASRRLLAVMGLPPGPGATNLWDVTERLARDESSRSSIAGALNAARENARAVRHVVPVELWERINATWAELPRQWELSRRVGPASYLVFVKNQTAAITGLADTTMSRDQTWLFFTLGRSLERADVLARQLSSLSFEDISDTGLVLLLRSCGGYEPYLRLSQGVVETSRVLDFLLRDRLFPRSAFASLTVAEDCLAQITSGRPAEWDEARGLVGLARAELEYSPLEALRLGLPQRLQQLQRNISLVSDAVTRRYFAHDLPTEWRRGAGS